MIPPVIILLALGGLMHAARSFQLPSEGAYTAAGTCLAFGFVLLCGFFTGRLAAAMRLPRVTGYMVAGIAVGPSALGLASKPMFDSLELVSGVAICLIALAAGGELNFKRLRPLFRSIFSMSVWAMGGTTILCAGGLMLLRPLLPFFDAMPLGGAVAVSVMLSVVLVTQSPAVVMALLEEMRAGGPVSQTMLGLVVIGDLVLVVLFSLASTAARALLGGAIDWQQTLGHVGWELGGSVIAGVLIGGVLALYLRFVRSGRGFFVLLISVVVSEIGHKLALDPLVVCLVAGLLMENLAEEEATKLVHAIEAASLPVYIVFFAVAGAMIDLELLRVMWIPALILVALRAFGLTLGSGLGAKRSAAPPAVARWAWAGLLPQAGLGIALAVLVARAFPSFGTEASGLLLAVIGINQLVTPILLRVALLRSGEAGTREASDDEADLASIPPPAPVPSIPGSS